MINRDEFTGLNNQAAEGVDNYYPRIRGDMAPMWEPTQRSYAGVDIIATGYIDGRLVLFDNISAISYSTHREKVNVPTLGRSYARRRTRGMRTIAGSIIWAVKDRTPLYSFLGQYKYDGQAFMHLPMSDSIPPFDITLTYANEYGHVSVMRIYGVDIMSEGQVHSIQDIITENVMEYQAFDMDVMMPIDAEAGELPWMQSSSGIFYRDISKLSTPANEGNAAGWADYQKYQRAVSWLSIFISDYDNGTMAYWVTGQNSDGSILYSLAAPDEIANYFKELGYDVTNGRYQELVNLMNNIRQRITEIRTENGLFWNLEENRQGISDGTISTASPFDLSAYTFE
jgi:hypothetical protein